MIRVASLALAAAVTAGGARAGESRCWFENGAVVVAAAFGDIAGDYILDLSAPRSLLHVTVAQAHGMVADGARADLRLAGERRRDFPIAIGDLDARSKGFVTGIDGVLGLDALTPFVVEIRFAPCRVRLYRRAPRPGPGTLMIRTRTIAGAPAARAAISDGTASRAGWFAVDTASLGVRVADAHLTRSPENGADPASRPAPPARLRALSLAGRLFEQTPAGLMADPPAGLDGAIGDAVWSRFQLRLDQRRQRLELAPMR